MEKALKEQQVSFVKDLVNDAEVLILTNIEGLSAMEVADLRKNLHESNVGFKVVKNKLARLAIKETAAEPLIEDFVGSTAVAWSMDDPVGPAKILVKFEKELEKFKIKAGFNASKKLFAKDIEALSKMPGLVELRAQLLGLINAPASKLLAQVNAPASNMVGVLQAKIDKDKN